MHHIVERVSFYFQKIFASVLLTLIFLDLKKIGPGRDNHYCQFKLCTISDNKVNITGRSCDKDSEPGNHK